MSHRPGPRISRRALLTWLGASALTLWHRDAWAAEPEVPVRLQVDLLNRVIPYDRNFRSRVPGDLVVLVAVDANDTDSIRTGAQLLSAIGDRNTLGGIRVRALRHSFSGTHALIDECRRSKPGIVYVTPGLRASASTIAAALTDLKLLSVAAMPDHVRGGMVLGFGVRSGKPRLLVNLTQARRQQVDFRADFLRMAEVVG